MKVWGERDDQHLYIGCVYMPTDITSVAVVGTLKKIYLVLEKRVRPS